jgi:hypothetical protein
MPFVILPTNSASGGYDVTNSLRFNAGSSDYLNRTPSSTTDRQKATLSFWTKYCDDTSGNIGRLFNFGLYPNGTLIYFGDGTYKGKLLIDSYVSTSATIGLVTTQLFRDYSAWYHIVVAFDTTQATASNRVKLYVNGTQVTTFDASVYPSQNENLFFNYSSSTYQIGKNHQPAYFSGYLAETYMIDGQQLTPSSFGETDSDTGIWKPKAFSGSYGTNGFYLQFKNSASLGTDSSGNGNTFTVNNLTSIDQTTDTPTNNFAIGNPLLGQSITWSDGNLTVSTGADWESSVSTIAVNKGKWYAEFKFVSGSYCNFGVTDIDDAMKVGDGYSGVSGSSFSIGHDQSNSYYTNGNTIANGNTFTTGDIISIALDMDNGKVHFAKNGTYELSSVPASNTGGLSLPSTNYYQFTHGNYSSSSSANFGNPPYSANSYTDGAGFGNFSYAVPSGYYSLNTKNLATFG